MALVLITYAAVPSRHRQHMGSILLALSSILYDGLLSIQVLNKNLCDSSDIKGEFSGEDTCRPKRALKWSTPSAYFEYYPKHQKYC